MFISSILGIVIFLTDMILLTMCGYGLEIICRVAYWLSVT